MTKKLPKPLSIEYWLNRIQELIRAHTSAPRTRGKYRGHGSTDVQGWIWALAAEVQNDIKRTRRGIGYDENMAIASTLGGILFTWYCTVHRAKGYDPNRPVKLRKKALKRRSEIVGELFHYVNDDALMTKVFSSQQWDLPYGKNAKNGKFV